MNWKKIIIILIKNIEKKRNFHQGEQIYSLWGFEISFIIFHCINGSALRYQN